ncbi:MAG: hypothetical protein HY435_00770 [Candidatus Liptonbacteria bacterium]|nr:hypothetical protein [Candidatus Liptonbacteria bacterium]
MKVEWNRVTWYSKAAAMIVFIVLPFAGFSLGRQFQAVREGVLRTKFETEIEQDQLLFQNLRENIAKYLDEQGVLCSDREVGECLDSLLAGTDIPLEPPAVITFGEPYSITWRDGNARFALTDASLGEMKASSKLLKDPYSPSEGTYREGEVVHALTLTLEVTTLIDTLVPVKFTRIVDETGRGRISNTRRYALSGDGTRDHAAGKANVKYANETVTFVVPEGDKEFLLATGGEPQAFFIVRLVNGILRVENIAREG